MATNVNVTVKATLKYGDGTAATSVDVKAVRQQDALMASTLAVADTASATSNSSTGIVSLTLVGNDSFPVTHKIILPDGQYLHLRLPKNAKSTNLGIITVSQTPAKTVKDITSQFSGVQWVGQDIASAATIVPTCDIHAVTGTTTITAVTGTDYPVGKILRLVFAGILTLTDGSGLKMAGDFTTSADDVWSGFYNGTDFIEVARSAN
jgi:hypothetical protein